LNLITWRIIHEANGTIHLLKSTPIPNTLGPDPARAEPNLSMSRKKSQMYTS